MLCTGSIPGTNEGYEPVVQMFVFPIVSRLHNWAKEKDESNAIPCPLGPIVFWFYRIIVVFVGCRGIHVMWPM
jgi:hypothetical protein